MIRLDGVTRAGRGELEGRRGRPRSAGADGTTGQLSMIGLFFTPAAATRQLPGVIRRRSRRTAAAPGGAAPDPQ